MIAKKGDGQLVTSVATYEGVPRAAGQYGAEVIMTPLTAEFGIDLDAMAGKVSKKTTATYVCNPNNPTGNMVDPVKLKAFAIEASKTAPCFIDEAYLDLCDDYAGQRHDRPCARWAQRRHLPDLLENLRHGGPAPRLWHCQRPNWRARWRWRRAWAASTTSASSLRWRALPTRSSCPPCGRSSRRGASGSTTS
jgi:hypothetical protein